MIGIGCDIIEIARLAKAIEKEHFVERVYTEQEIAYCCSRGKQAAASFAARFAAKEAVLKAFGTGLRGGKLTEIEVVLNELGKPAVKLYGYHKDLAERLGVNKIHLSLSHSQGNAVAFVTME